MIRNKAYLVLLTCALIASCSNITESDIIGSYANTNYQYEAFVSEIPYNVDTLHILPGNTFKSSYFGDGSYTLESNGLRLVYEYEFGKASFRLPVRKKGGTIVLMLNSDNDHYYKKLKVIGD